MKPWCHTCHDCGQHFPGDSAVEAFWKFADHARTAHPETNTHWSSACPMDRPDIEESEAPNDI